MAWAIKGSFGTSGSSAGQFSVFWGFGITVSGGFIYIPSGQTRNTIYKFNSSTFAFDSESTTSIFSPAVFSQGAIQGSFLFVRDNWTALNKINISSWVNVRNTGALVGWCCSDSTKTYIGSNSTGALRSYLNSDLTQSQTLTLPSSINRVALDDEFVYAVNSGASLVRVVSKSSFTVIDSWSANSSAGSSAGSICAYNDHLLLPNGASGLHIYNVRSKVLFATISNPVGSVTPHSVFADASGIYVTYTDINKVYVYTNDIPLFSGALTLNRKTSPYNFGQKLYD